jgi:hypothetical protein
MRINLFNDQRSDIHLMHLSSSAILKNLKICILYRAFDEHNLLIRSDFLGDEVDHGTKTLSRNFADRESCIEIWTKHQAASRSLNILLG